MYSSKIIAGIIIIVAALSISMSAQAQTTHRVQEGETLYIIAKKYDIKVSDILKANPGSGVDLSDYDELILPAGAQLELAQEDVEKIKSEKEPLHEEITKEKESAAVETAENTTVVELATSKTTITERSEAIENPGEEIIDKDLNSQLTAETNFAEEEEESIEKATANQLPENKPELVANLEELGYPEDLTILVRTDNSKNEVVKETEEVEQEVSPVTASLQAGPVYVYEDRDEMPVTTQFNLLNQDVVHQVINKQIHSNLMTGDKSKLQLKENFFLIADPEGAIQEITDERTEMNSNTRYLNQDDMELLKSLELVFPEGAINASQKAPVGLYADVEKTIYNVKIKKKKIIVLSGRVYTERLDEAHPHYSVIRSEWEKRELKKGKYTVTVLDGEYGMASMKDKEYNPFHTKASDIVAQKILQVATIIPAE